LHFLIYIRALLSSFSSTPITTITQAFHHASEESFCPSIAILGDKHSTRKCNPFRILSRNSMGHVKMLEENGSVSQYRHFLYEKFPSNDKSLYKQIKLALRKCFPYV